MVQFLSIIFFSWISSFFVGFFKISRFFVTLYFFKNLVDRHFTLLNYADINRKQFN